MERNRKTKNINFRAEKYNNGVGWLWLMAVIPATQEAEIRRILL
jgi:hypothetical protein